MKSLNILITLTLTIGLTACRDAGKGVPNSIKLLEPNRVYEVDALGSNPDIYEFTPVGHEYMACLIVVSD
jgi:hypothetical protein